MSRAQAYPPIIVFFSELRHKFSSSWTFSFQSTCSGYFTSDSCVHDDCNGDSSLVQVSALPENNFVALKYGKYRLLGVFFLIFF